ncbi:MAG TPA: S41 family peptidase [Bryobacteraceae bacterium]|nr:S41 family peptidase [Bryobacteraceae bacterium]
MPVGARLLSAGVLLAVSLGAQSSGNDGLGGGKPGESSAQPLTGQGLGNVAALARLFGLVRYFDPSDAAAATDWDRFAVSAVRTVEPATSPFDLASKLESVFAPAAPRVRVVPAGAPRPMMEMESGRFAVLWQHRGLGPPQGKPPYFSGRFEIPAEQSPLVSFAPYHSDLPGGVTCMVPLAVYRPLGPLPQARPLGPPEGSANDRAVRLAAVIVAWNVFQHFYPYFDADLSPVWMGALGRLLSEAAQDANAQAFHATLQKMAVILHDGQGRVTGPGDPPDSVPPVVWTMADGRITALAVQGTDVKPGDVLVSVDGKPAGDVLAAKEKDVPGSTPQCLRERALPYLLARAPGGKVSVELEPAAQPGARRTVTLECTARAGDLHPPRPDKIAELEPGIFYVDVNRVSMADFSTAVAQLAKARGILYDLRGSQSLPQFFSLFGHLLMRGVQGPPTAAPIVTRPDQNEIMFQETQWSESPLQPYFPGKRAFLTDGGTIGSAETMAAIAERYRLAEIVGETTGGAAGGVNSFSVPGGYEFTWTGERVRQYDGSPLFGAGIRPTIPVAPTRAGIAAGRDEVLQRALEAVK